MSYSSQTRVIDHSGMTIKAAAIELTGDMSQDDVTADTGTFDEVVFSGLTGNTLQFDTYQATVTVADGQTTGQEAAIAMPAHFLPIAVAVHVTVASTNASNLTDIGDEGDTDSFVDTIAVSVATTGFKGIFSCNGLRGFPGGTSNTGALGTADEVMVTVSADPGATGATMRLTFLGIVAS